MGGKLAVKIDFQLVAAGSTGAAGQSQEIDAVLPQSAPQARGRDEIGDLAALIPQDDGDERLRRGGGSVAVCIASIALRRRGGVCRIEALRGCLLYTSRCV